MFRNATLRCLTEIGGLTVPPVYEPKVVKLYNSAVEALNNMIPMNPSLGMELVTTTCWLTIAVDIATAYENGSDEEQEFVQNIALFLTSFLCEHLKVCVCFCNRLQLTDSRKLVENQDNKQPLLMGHMYLLKISKVDDREVFKTSLEYWTKLVGSVGRYIIV